MAGAGARAAGPPGAGAVVVPKPDLRIPLSLLGASAAFASAGWTKSAGAAGIFGAFLAVQSQRVKFKFDSQSLEVLLGGDEPEEMVSSGENVFVGGENKWAFSSFVNWEIFPSPKFPVLVYFKETQTKPEGQVHFFPIIFSFDELYPVMVERCGASQNSGPQ